MHAGLYMKQPYLEWSVSKQVVVAFFPHFLAPDSTFLLFIGLAQPGMASSFKKKFREMCCSINGH